MADPSQDLSKRACMYCKRLFKSQGIKNHENRYCPQRPQILEEDAEDADHAADALAAILREGAAHGM